MNLSLHKTRAMGDFALTLALNQANLNRLEAGEFQKSSKTLAKYERIKQHVLFPKHAHGGISSESQS